MNDRYDVAVVGGGIAGLTAATLAARAGSRVVLLDPHPFGGRARTTERHGFHFNQGPHAVYDAGELRAVLDRLGIRVTGGAPHLKDAWWWYRGEAHRFPTGAGSLLTNRVLSTRAKAGLGKVLARAPHLDPAAHAHRSIGEWVDALGLPDEGMALLHVLLRTATYANAPDLLSADAGVQQLQRSIVGVTYLDGGWQSIVDALAGAAAAAGVDLVAGVGVDGLSRSGSRWDLELHRAGAGAPEAPGTPVVATGVEATAVVLAAGSPARSAALLGEDPGWTATAGPAVLASCLDLGVDAPAGRTLLFGADEPIYLSTHTPPARLAPEGLGVIQVAEYLVPGSDRDAASTRARLHEHARRAGVQDGHVVTERYLHRMAVTHGMPLASQGGFGGRPPVTVPGHDGLFVAGDWVGRRGLLADAAAASAEDAAALAVAHAARVAV